MAGLDSISNEQLEVFKEIGNIGAGNAASSLAHLLGKTIAMEVPRVKLLPFSQIPNIVGGPAKVLVGGMVGVSGDLCGYLILVLGLEQARDMVCGLFDRKTPEGKADPLAFSDMDKSALSEIMNIVCGSYISAISAFTGLSMMPTTPYICIDMVGAVLSVVAIEYGSYGDKVLLFDTRFTDSDSETIGQFFLAPDEASYHRLLGSLGVDS